MERKRGEGKERRINVGKSRRGGGKEESGKGRQKEDE